MRQLPLPTFPFGLLGPDDPAPVERTGPPLSPWFLTCDHGGNHVPAALDLGVGDADLARHIGYDIGAAAVARIMATRLAAELVIQIYSRLVIDCNRPPSEPSAFPERSDGTEILGNIDLTGRDGASRTAEIFHPYHAAIEAALDRRADAGVATHLVAVHSYTPAHGEHPEPRPWPVCVLFDKDPSLSLALSRVLAEDGVLVGENVPYQVGALGDYTVPVHGERRKIPHTLIEVRQDLIGDEAGQREWAERLSLALPRAMAACERKLP
ncbi:N-formylglutamate amidohydrolase [Acuticoccus sp. MNP-M23]|uniref:N-formylglutamate amidohydrolase n=1 Tax=Acuticoccus sp. MNP-M23 TaxID=3072793 RepID=UPI002815B334|nr:N-formylglutamate amidohydrolase [Acuticoccus sp. MNP-M23]WMS42098.1 N-formylglutamate amidohydrolase [Acuticoccus sp. MNP-M23]